MAVGEPFKQATNLGPHINTQAIEASPALSSDGLELWFASDRTPSFGQRDLWMSRRATTADPFGPPSNVCSPINTRDDEESPTFSADGQLLLFESSRVVPGKDGGRSEALEFIWMSFRKPREPDPRKVQP